MTSKVRLFAEDISFSSENFDKSSFFVEPPKGFFGRFVIGVFVLSFLMFFYSLGSSREWVVVVSFFAIPTLPLFLLWLDSLRPQDSHEAYFDEGGLYFVFKSVRHPRFNAELRVPIEDIESFIVESMDRNLGRLGHYRFRQYRIKTHRQGAMPNLVINTYRPFRLIVNDIKRLELFSWASLVKIVFVASQKELLEAGIARQNSY